MPTPMPIMAVTCGANEGTSSTWASSSTMARPMLMPASAVMIGRPIASSEPKATSRMTTAARMPTTSLAGMVCSTNIGPAELELHRVVARVLHQVAHAGGLGEVDVVGPLVELDLGVGDRLRRRDEALVGRVAVERRRHRGDVGLLGQLVEHRLHDGQHRGIGR